MESHHYRRGDPIKTGVRVALVMAVLAMVYFCTGYVPENKQGVLWERFDGTNFERTYEPGFHFKCPFDLMYTYPSILLNRDAAITCLNSKGLSFNVAYSYSYKLNPLLLPDLHKNVGPDYEKKLVKAELESLIRTEFAKPVENMVELKRRCNMALDANLRFVKYFTDIQFTEIQAP